MPNRTSLPSMLPPTTPAPAATSTCGLGWASKAHASSTEPSQSDAMTAASAYPWRRLPTIFPNVPVSANGITRSKAISSRFVNGFGFSNG